MPESAQSVVAVVILVGIGVLGFALITPKTRLMPRWVHIDIRLKIEVAAAVAVLSAPFVVLVLVGLGALPEQILNIVVVVVFVGFRLALWSIHTLATRNRLVLILSSFQCSRFRQSIGAAVSTVCGLNRAVGLETDKSFETSAVREHNLEGDLLQGVPGMEELFFEHDTWKGNVKALLGHVRLVIVDVTETSPGLLREVNMLEQVPGAREKALFLSIDPELSKGEYEARLVEAMQEQDAEGVIPGRVPEELVLGLMLLYYIALVCIGCSGIVGFG